MWLRRKGDLAILGGRGRPGRGSPVQTPPAVHLRVMVDCLGRCPHAAARDNNNGESKQRHAGRPRKARILFRSARRCRTSKRSPIWAAAPLVTLDDVDEDDVAEAQRLSEEDQEARPDAFDQNLVDKIDDNERFRIGPGASRIFLTLTSSLAPPGSARWRWVWRIIGLDDIPVEAHRLRKVPLASTIPPWLRLWCSSRPARSRTSAARGTGQGHPGWRVLRRGRKRERVEGA